MDNTDIKNLTYKNVKIDFEHVQNKLKNVNHLRIVQIISVGIGAILLSAIILDHWDPKHPEFKNKKDELKFIANEVLLTFPFTLEKQNKNVY